MQKRLVSLFLCLMLLLAAAPAAMADEANAPAQFISLQLEAGDTIYDLCRSFGVDFIAAKAAIMELNGWTQESQMNRLQKGDVIVLPLPGYLASITSAPEFGADEIAYYVVPYEIQAGDSLVDIYAGWGLRFDRYADLIRMLNGVVDLDVLSVGTVYYLPTTAENVYGSSYITVMMHLMRAGETAYEVFTAYGIDYNRSLPILQAYNGGADLARISIGDKLWIPLV